MQLLASDYDGTLKPYSAADEPGQRPKVGQRELDAIAAFRRRGNLFGISTGRSKGMIQYELEQYGVEIDFLVAQNGGAIWGRDYELLHVNEISRDAADALAERMMSRQAVRFGAADLETFGSFYDNKPDEEREKRLETDKMPFVKLTPEIFQKMRVISFFIKTESEDAAQRLEEELTRLFDGKLSFHRNRDVIDVTAYGASKATGVQWIEQHYRPDRVAVIGDGMNDLPMIRAYHGFTITGGAEGLRPYAERGFDNVAQCLWYLMEEGG